MSPVWLSTVIQTTHGPSSFLNLQILSSFKHCVYTLYIFIVNGKHKTKLLGQARELKRTKVYLNKHLIKNKDIARHARIVKKQNKIQATWTRNCKVMIWLAGTAEEAKVITVRELKDLDQFRWFYCMSRGGVAVAPSGSYDYNNK